MKRRSILLLVLCGFLAGVFLGIWLEWSAWKKTAGVREIAYELENYQMANLRVHAGDTIYLVAPKGGNATGIKMNFVGNVPCVDQNTPNKCVISDKVPTGAYFFNCDSDNGYTCPDPGIQPSSTYPLDYTFLGAVEIAFHLAGVQSAPDEEREPVQTKPAHALNGTVTAILSCDKNNNTALNYRNGQSANPMSASLGESVFWLSPPKFTLSGLPAGLCSNGNPTGGDGGSPAECDLDPNYQGSKTVNYQAQQDQCGATAATLQIQ